MQYLGGKSFAGRALVEMMEHYRKPGTLFVDSFCGALNVVRHARNPRLALDVCRPLMVMWQSAMLGWEPPSVVTLEEYQRFKSNQDPNDPRTAFVLFGCSHAGKWAAGYAKNRPEQHYAACAANGVRRKIRDCQGIELRCQDYQTLEEFNPGTVIYCDPPYDGLTGYGATAPFDSKAFWVWATRRAEMGSLVFVSEGYGAANGWVPLTTVLRGPGHGGVGGRKYLVDRLYVHVSSPMAKDADPAYRKAAG